MSLVLLFQARKDRCKVRKLDRVGLVIRANGKERDFCSGLLLIRVFLLQVSVKAAKQQLCIAADLYGYGRYIDGDVRIIRATSGSVFLTRVR